MVSFFSFEKAYHSGKGIARPLALLPILPAVSPIFFFKHPKNTLADGISVSLRCRFYLSATYRNGTENDSHNHSEKKIIIIP